VIGILDFYSNIWFSGFEHPRAGYRNAVSWREAATEKLRKIGEKVASDVEAALEEPVVEANPPAVIDLTDKDAPLDPAH
jgi:hypothetical protein